MYILISYLSIEYKFFIMEKKALRETRKSIAVPKTKSRRVGIGVATNSISIISV
jgi:hypothetical protein